MTELAERFATQVWRFHFRIPPSAYWALAVLGTAALVLGLPPSAAVWIFAILLAAQGIFRWRWHKRHSVAMVVSRFSTVPGREPLAVRVQELVLTQLRDKLPQEYHAFVHPLPAIVGTADRQFASTLLRRLQCVLLVHGRVEERADGNLAVFARSAQPAERTVLHYDWHTRDRTPARARWRHLFELLTPTEQVQITEYPLEFATELEAVARGFVGQLLFYAGAPANAEPFLRAALDVAPDSTSHQVDQIRALLASSLQTQDRLDEALELLRTRARGDDPSPELLRTLAFLLHRGDQPQSEADAQEAIAALRRAAEHETDPALDMTLYNLAVNLVGRSEDEEREAEQLFTRLLHSSSFYRGTWYLSRHLGAISYHQALAESDPAAARVRFEVAASFYSKALRARPHIRFFDREGFRTSIIRIYPRSPILLANAVDAHREARHTFRTRWLEWRFQRLRTSFMQTAERALREGNWSRSYAYGDWAIVGRQDSAEAVARLIKAVAARQMGWESIADEEWTLASQLDPLTLVLRAQLAQRSRLPRGVPGPEPTDEGES